MEKLELLIFYFSGTGNTLFIAKELKKKFQKVKILPLSKLKDSQQIIKNSSKIALLYPTYYIHAPNFVIENIKEHQFYFKNKKLILLNTYSGNSGHSIHDIFNILTIQTQFIQNFSIRMPGSYYSEYAAFPSWYQDFILDRANKKLEQIISTIQLEQQTKLPSLSIVSKLYNQKSKRVIKNFKNLDKLFFTTTECINCSICKKVCPVNNISATENIVWHNHCEQCMACLQWCPKYAIKVETVATNRKRYTNPQHKSN